MGNQHTICCADTTGRLDNETASFDGLSHASPNSGRGKPRLLRRLVDAIRTTGRKDQVGPQQSSAGFFKGKFASGQMMLEMEIDPDEPVVETRKMAARKSSIMYSTAPSPPPQQQQLQSMSSMSTGGSESGERSREARTDRSFTRRLSTGCDREDVEGNMRGRESSDGRKATE